MTSPIVFFGSGPVAAASLRLLAQDFTIEVVVTKPRPAHHRGSVPVLEAAASLGLRVLEASNKHELSQLVSQHHFASPLAVLIDFGIIVGQDVIDSFPKGIINSHFSLLPEWRGADPITFSILSGQPQTGVSLMLLSAGMDEGPLLAQTPYDLPADVTTPLLTETLIELSYQSLRQIIPLWLNDETAAAPQEAVTLATEKIPTYSRKLTKQDSILDFTKPAEQLEREVRAFIEWPKSRTTLAGKEVVITRAHVAEGSGTPGSIYKESKNLGIYTAHGIFMIDELKPAGKNAMLAAAFLAGYGAQL